MRTFLKVILILFLAFWMVPVLLASVLGVLGIALPVLWRPHAAYSPALHPVGFSLGLPEMVILVAIALGVVVFAAVILRLVFHGSNGSYREAPADESRMMQEIYRSLSRMEKRVEALETILLDRVRKDCH